MKLAHIAAFAIATVIGISTLGAPAHAGIIGKVLGLPDFSGVKRPQTQSAPSSQASQPAKRDPSLGVDYSWVKKQPRDPRLGVDYSWVKR